MTSKAHFPFSRRQFLRLGGLFALGSAGASARSKPESQGAMPSSAGKRVLRIAHLTDIRIYPDARLENKVASAFRHAQSQIDVPIFILNTGDSIMDSLATDQDRASWFWIAPTRPEKSRSIPISVNSTRSNTPGWTKRSSRSP